MYAIARLRAFKSTSFVLYQYEQNGEVADSLLIHTILVLLHITKFFSWEDGYMSAMDNPHDRGLSILLAYIFHCPFNFELQVVINWIAIDYL
jgi:hypothetical protein